MISITRVFIVAPSPVVRAGLRSMLLATVDGFEVVGESAALAAEEPTLPEADVIVVADEGLLEDASLAEDGTQGLLLLADEEGAVGRLRSLAARGWGVVPPDAPPEEFAAAVSAVAQGLVTLPRHLAEQMFGSPAAAVEELSEPLTAREGEVLELVGRGLPNKLIARELHISEHTVKFHVSSLYAKLGVTNRAEAVSQGARRGLISL